MTEFRPPGHPGIPPRWTSSAKTGVGTAPGNASPLWFTLSHGIVNEVYYPTVDQANTRDLGLLVADGASFFSEEKRHTRSKIEMLAPRVPGFRLTNRCLHERYEISKVVLADPSRPVLLQLVTFRPILGDLSDYGLYALLAPHISNQGSGNSGWVGDYKGIPMLFAARERTALALACSVPFAKASCGYVGVSDGWQDVNAHKRMTWLYPEATDGNIALTGEIDLAGSKGCFVLALAFGGNAAEAGQRARASLSENFEEVQAAYARGWEDIQRGCVDLGTNRKRSNAYRTSLATLKVHEAKSFSGGMIASLSVPWGFARGDGDLGGYHLVWPRDLVECAQALLAAGDAEGARRTLFYLMCTQESDGHWQQNMWLDGRPNWQGVQADETAFFILLADALRRRGELHGPDPWPSIRRAASFLLRSGPVTEQDRWEENRGYSPFTLAVEVAALLAAADFAEEAGEGSAATFLRESADAWNSAIERWTYATGTELARRVGVDGYYVRIAPPEALGVASLADVTVTIHNRPPAESRFCAAAIVSPDALALVRFGLRAPGDPRIVNTVKVIDAVVKAETATGPAWHRYNHDGYGEREDGRPFDGTGIGRCWPLLTGERAHYELAVGRKAEARRLLAVMEAQAGPGGLLPEQIWNAEDIPERELFNGRPSGSARPLAWAHAEHIKLLRSIDDGQVFDTPPQTVARYQDARLESPHSIWRLNHQNPRISKGKTLRVEATAAAIVRWTADDWKTVTDSTTTDTGLGVHLVDLLTGALPVGSRIVFTFLWESAGDWQGRDFQVIVEDPTGRNPGDEPS